MEERALVKNANSEKQVKSAQTQEELIEARKVKDMQFVLNYKEGRRLLWRYLSACGIFEQSFTGNSHTFFNEGRRSIGLKLITEINEANVDAYLLMVKENQEGDYNNV